MGGIFRLSVAGPSSSQPPVWSQTPSFSPFAGGQTTAQPFASFVSDPDTPSLTFAKVGTWPSWLTIVGSTIQVSSLAPVTTVSGLVISASDGTTTVNSAAFSVQVVKATNRAPVWNSSIPSIPMAPTQSTPATFNLNTVCSDLDGDVLSYQITPPLTLPTGYSLTTAGVLSISTAAAAGSQALQFRAWDGGSVGAGANTDSPNITFVVASQAPAWSGWTTPVTISAGAPIDLHSYFTSPSGLSMTFALVAGALETGVTLDTNTGIITATSAAIAASLTGLQFRATDSASNVGLSPANRTLNVVVTQSALSYLGSIQLPVISGTQIAFGPKTSPAYYTKNRQPGTRPIYIVGGTVTQAGQSGPGSQTVFKFDYTAGTLTIDSPYFLPAGQVQPSHPDGVAFFYDSNISLITFYPGVTS